MGRGEEPGFWVYVEGRASGMGRQAHKSFIWFILSKPCIPMSQTGAGGGEVKRPRALILRLQHWEGGTETPQPVGDTAGPFLCPRLCNEGVKLMPVQRACRPHCGV